MCLSKCFLDCFLRHVLIVIQAGVVCQWTSDAQRFLLEHFDTIHNSPSQIYHSALPFCPSESWICKKYSSELLNQVKVIRGLPAEWGRCSRTVPLTHMPVCLSYWNNTIAAGLQSGDIVIMNAIAGRKTGLFSGHSDTVMSVKFSSDGVFLASGSSDRTIKLWDMQTGGIVRAFLGHEQWVSSVSISADSTILASGSGDNTIRLWDIQTGECNCVIEQASYVHVHFFPTSSQHLMAISANKVQEWDATGHKIGPEYAGSCLAFSLDGAQFALCNGSTVTVQETKSRTIVSRFHVDSETVDHCCFSPDGRFIAARVNHTAFVWSIPSSHPHPIGIFCGHSDYIWALAFSSHSTLISASRDTSIKLWQICASSTDKVETNSQYTMHPSDQVLSITLQAVDGVIITSDKDGMVKVWDIFTGNCKRSIQTPLKLSYERDARLINSRLIFVWCEGGKIHIWDAEKQELLLQVGKLQYLMGNLKISGDGSKVFILKEGHLKAWSILTGEERGSVVAGVSEPRIKSPLTVDSSKVWVRKFPAEWRGWDFGTPEFPVELSKSPSKLHPNGTILWDIVHSRVQDVAGEKILFQLNAGLRKPADVQWREQYLVVCFRSGEVLILDFSHVILQ